MSDIKDSNNSIHSQGQSSGASLTGLHNIEKERTDMIVRKAEKLTTALYMVSDIISDKEPIKWKMRETGVELLSDITLSGTASQSERLSYLRNVVKRIEKIVSFLEIAWVTRMLSEMNASLLKGEYLELRHQVESLIGGMLGGVGLRDMTLPPMYSVKKPAVTTEPAAMKNTSERSTPPAIPRFQQPLPEERKATQQFGEKGVVSRIPPIERIMVSRAQEPKEKPMSVITPAKKETESLRREPVIRPTSNTDQRAAKDDRRKIILALLKQKPALTVKDISISITGFSEKTIQRELVAMLEEGILSKHGEKRWTTYSLNHGQ